jgi:signal transduction histidine kinase
MSSTPELALSTGRRARWLLRLVGPNGADPPDDVRSGLPQDVRSMVHDLRQPVACISALVASCRASLEAGQSPAAQLAGIDQQLAHLQEMVARVLGDAGPDGRAAQTASLPSVVDDAVTFMRLVHSVDAEVDIDAGDRLDVNGSPTSLRRALVNVLENAVHAAGPEARVVVSAQREGQGEVRVHVEDDGPGFGQVPSGHLVGLRSASDELAGSGGRLEVSSSPRLRGAQVTLVLRESGRGSTVTRSDRGRRRHAAPGL